MSTALQCGFCTPGMIMASKQLLADNPNPTEQEIRHGTRRQSLPLHRLPAHRERGEAAAAQRREEHNHGDHHHQTRNARRQAHPPPRRSAPDHRHRHLPRRYQDARHASRLHRAQPARAPPRSSASTPRPRSTMPGVVAVFTGADVEAPRRRAVRRLAARTARAASSPAGPGSRLLRRPSRGRGGRHRPLHRARRGRPGRSRVRADCRPWPIPRRRSRPARPPVHPEWPDNVAFTFHQEGGDTDQAFRDAEVSSSSASPASG